MMIKDTNNSVPVTIPLKHFKHSKKLCSEIGVKRLIRAFGFEGYGRYMCLLELLTDLEEHSFPMNDDDYIGLIAYILKFGSDDDAQAFVSRLVEFGLLVSDGDSVSSPIVNDEAQAKTKRRVYRRRHLDKKTAALKSTEQGAK